MFQRVLLNLVGSHAAQATAAVTSPALVKSRVALYNPSEVSATWPAATLLASPAAFLEGSQEHLDESAGVAAKAETFADAELAVADYEAVLPVSHHREAEDAWKGVYGEHRGVLEYAHALRWVMGVFRRRVEEAYRAMGKLTPRVGFYGDRQLLPAAIVGTTPEHLALTPEHRAMFRPGGPYAFLWRDVGAVCSSYYLANEFAVESVGPWIAGAASLQASLLGRHRRRLRGRRKPAFYPYLCPVYTAGAAEGVVCQAGDAEAVLNALAALPYMVTPVLWASVKQEGEGESIVTGEQRAEEIADAINDEWAPVAEELAR